jgi:hypothetical protein
MAEAMNASHCGSGGAPSPPGAAWRRLTTAAVAAVWLALLAGPPLLLLREREAWLERLERPAVRADWDAFRDDMRRQSGRDGPVPGPVQRKVPKSAEPPALVWLRDHVGLAIAAWLLFVGVLGGFFCLMVAGAVTARGPRPASLAQDQLRGERDHQEQDDGDGEHTQEGKHGAVPKQA